MSFQKIINQKKKLNWFLFSYYLKKETWDLLQDSPKVEINLNGFNLLSHDGLNWLMYICFLRKQKGFSTTFYPPEDWTQRGYLKYCDIQKLEYICGFNFELSTVFDDDKVKEYKATHEYKSKFKSIKYINGDNWVKIIRELGPAFSEYLSKELGIPLFTDAEDEYIRPLVKTLEELIQNIGSYGGNNEGSGFGFASVITKPEDFQVIRYAFSDIGLGFYTTLQRKEERSKLIHRNNENVDKLAIYNSLLFRYFYPKSGLIGYYPLLNIMANFNGKIRIRNRNIECFLDLSVDKNKDIFFEQYDNPTFDWLEKLIITNTVVAVEGTHVLIELNIEGGKKMIVIDPLKEKLKTFLKNGNRFPLNLAMQKYGTEEDLVKLLDLYKETELDDERRYKYIDLTTFQRMDGFLDRFLSRIEKFQITKTIPVALVISKNIIEHYRKGNGIRNACIVNFNKDGTFDELFFFPGESDYIRNEIEDDFQVSFSKKKTFNQFRKEYAEYFLTQKILSNEGVLLPNINNKKSYLLGGKLYRVMQNNMLVSSYLDLKTLCKNIDNLVDIAYEVVLNVNNYFVVNGDEYQFNKIIVANNTSLLIASIIQKIIEKNVIAIDKLGPIPTLKLESESLREQLKEELVIVFEEVMSTGSEVDRIVMFLNHMEANIVKIIALYNLDIGGPKVVDSELIVKLSSPKEVLKYEYRSK